MDKTTTGTGLQAEDTGNPEPKPTQHENPNQEQITPATQTSIYINGTAVLSFPGIPGSISFNGESDARYKLGIDNTQNRMFNGQVSSSHRELFFHETVVNVAVDPLVTKEMIEVLNRVHTKIVTDMPQDRGKEYMEDFQNVIARLKNELFTDGKDVLDAAD